MKNYLLISLGHNSSAALVKEDGEIIAYEQERIDGIKSSSQFPIDAIAQIIKHSGIKSLQGSAIRISHWFDFKSHYENKYITASDYGFLMTLSDDIQFVSKAFTHHDAHAMSAFAFFKNKINFLQYAHIVHDPLYSIVADGFGNNREVISIYKSVFDTNTNQPTKPELIMRAYGYESSLGLMYQYATSFCGMKENQDEYKFLGYESHIDEQFSHSDINKIDLLIDKSTVELTDRILGQIQFPYSYSTVEAVIDTTSLITVRERWISDFMDVLRDVNVQNRKSYEARCAIAYFIQGVIENVMYNIIHRYNMQNVILSGGIFYNVKLNNSVLRHVSGLTCIMPLAGDQGAAFGFVEKEGLITLDFKDLCFGKRKLNLIEKLTPQFTKAKVVTVNDTADRIAAVKYITEEILKGKIVNVVTGNMEFGPRALCNTSTLMLPLPELTEQNNVNNNRNEVMPCAPVIRIENVSYLFDEKELSRVVGSDNFMICTHDYLRKDGTFRRKNGGVMHRRPLSDSYTGRPQIVSDGLIWEVLIMIEALSSYKMIVNTSFNSHGRPIAFDTIQVIENYKYQVEHSSKSTPRLIVIK